jgi:hypothetical protein
LPLVEEFTTKEPSTVRLDAAETVRVASPLPSTTMFEARMVTDPLT